MRRVNRLHWKNGMLFMKECEQNIRRGGHATLETGLHQVQYR